jgi:hypothetical protein
MRKTQSPMEVACLVDFDKRPPQRHAWNPVNEEADDSTDDEKADERDESRRSWEEQKEIDERKKKA